MQDFTFTVGKLDAGMAILLGERAHLIEFPSVLLPPGATTGSIVNISVHQNIAEEKRRDTEFWDLQDQILGEFGMRSPEAPQLQLRHTTQTSVTLEWPTLQLATAKIRSLVIYRNGERLAPIPYPLTNTSTKLSSLEVNTEYTFQLILRTTAGTFPSNVLRVRTHTMTDTSGISVCFGTMQDTELLERAKAALREMKAKWTDKIAIDTTHFVCTTPNSKTNSPIAPAAEYQRAEQLSIPIVQPHWIFACLTEKKLVPVAQFGLGAILPPPARQPAPPPPPPESDSEGSEGSGSDSEEDVGAAVPSSVHEKRMSRPGTMNRDFKFPTPVSSPTVENTHVPAVRVVTPSNIEVPAPPPMEKEGSLTRPSPPRSASARSDDGDELGDTEEISLN
ncbi:Chitin biosynthesis protein [Mycena indigotica]|uniref:Chitin biosynthesis protein n=1 Tax=Mycena indigotica TaxID=2126181 RepID=A0A8H6W0L3_9AGAR|nr:Chitin biosynthesis protein [Mycena indigotica]KAF7298651.1 Chitin biosynthesis protein [Mycena indigotica]